MAVVVVVVSCSKYFISGSATYCPVSQNSGSSSSSTIEYHVSAHPIIFSLEGNSSLLRAISGKRPPIDFSG